MPSPIDAQNAALDAYNVATQQLNDAQAALDAMTARPDDTALGHDAGGKEWDRDHDALVKKVEDARSQAAAASKQYASILTEQAKQDATDASPGAQARAARAKAQADYYNARSEGLAAKDAATEKAAQTRADAAQQRANTASDRLASQNDKDTSAADLNRANADRARAETANMQTPDQAHAFRLSEIAAQAKAQGQAALTEWQAKVDQGYVMKPEDEANLKASLDQIAAEAASKRDQALAEFKHNLDQPNVQAGLDIQKQNADTSAAQVESARIYQANQTELSRRTQEGDALKQQSAAGQSALDQIVKAGSAIPVSAASLRAVTSPLDAFWKLAHQQIGNGQLQPSALPTPAAPQPAPAPQQPPQAPLPADYPAAA